LATKAGVGVLLGLIAVAVSLLVSVWIGRGLVLELVGLRDAALDLARRRLPRAIGRLRAGESVDLETEALSVPFLSAVGFAGLAGASGTRASGAQDEVGEVAQALATVHRAALRAALDRAEAISGVSDVFVSLARRSQVLLHRQLELLDLMERRIDDTRDLEDLFRLDHMATRMRRHAEGLIILSGAAPGRGWRKPAPLMDVVRAAVAEVEDYARVDVRRLPDVYVAGAAIADLTHLLAELVENATVFSPPHTRVHVQGSMIGAGFALQIEDRGLGMSFEALNDANRRIESARQDDLLDSDRLGLFVVSRLARRHGIRVMLQQSARGGTTAVVLLPQDLLEATSQDTTSVTMIKSMLHAKTALEESAPAERETVLVSAGHANSNHVSAEPSIVEPSAPPPHVTRPLNAPAHTRPEIPADPPLPESLPRRTRQANLAPGLRSEPTQQPGAEAEDDDEPTVRTPEQARATMSAYQQGWSLGRAASESADTDTHAGTDADADAADTYEQPVNSPTS
jgi:signal transduction histidine kinase